MIELIRPAAKMCRWMIAAILIVVSLGSSSLCSGSKIRIESDGGYSGIVIKINDDGSVPEDECPKILANLQKLLEDSSFTLHEALNQKAFLKSATVVIPKAWRDGKCQTVVRQPKGETPYRKPDILIAGDNHPIYGASPYTQQSKQCGQPGDLMSIPYSFLTKWNQTWETWGDPSKLFVHEWAKLRYGTFDEFGFANDPIYPNYFMSRGHIFPTGTSNEPIDGIWVDAYGNPDCISSETKACYFQPIGTNDHVTCSLGYMHFLPSVNAFCPSSSDGQGHVAPSKQNVLCDGRSSLEVILGHEDFSSHSSYKNKAVDINMKPLITVVREPEAQYVLIMETSSSLDDHGQWKWINKAAQKFIRYDLPVNSNLAIVTFSNSSEVQHSMVQVHNDDVRGMLADTIPDKYHLNRDKSGVKCLLCGIKKAIHEVLRSNMAGAHLILVTRGSQDTLSISDEQSIQEYIRYYHIKVSSILIPGSDKPPLAFFDSIAQLSGGLSHIVKEARHRTVKTYVALMDAFSALLRGQELMPRVIHKDVIQMNGYSSTTGSFTVDPSLGKNTKFGIFVEDEEDHLIKSITFTDSKGFLYGPYTSMSSVYDIINLKAINFPVGGSPPFDEDALLGTVWQYFIEWYSGGSTRQRSAILITSEPRDLRSDYEVNIWTNSGVASDIVSDHRPLAVYVQVERGHGSPRGWGPVLEAKVEVQVLVNNQNGTASSMKMRLWDNGSGDPDLVSGDGIYSRYLTSYFSAGRYEFQVTVTDNNQRAYTIRTNRSRPKQTKAKRALPIINHRSIGRPMPESVVNRCCGSRVTVPDSRKQVTGQFKRTQQGPVIHLLSVPSNHKDLMPPARIGDLQIKIHPKSKRSLEASWTAPGDDFDHGTVQGYKIVFSRNKSALLQHRGDYEILEEFQRPDNAGKATSYQFSFQHYFSDYHLGLVAFDERRNEGRMSNIVTVFLDSNDIAVPIKVLEDSADNQVSKAPQEQDDGVMIGILCGTFAVIGLLLWAGLYWVKNQKSSSTKNGGVTANLVSVAAHGGGEDNGHDTTSSDCELKPTPNSTTGASALKVLPVNGEENRLQPLMPQFSSIASGGPIGQYPGKGDNANTPTYWSASKLLDEHENRNIYSDGVVSQQNGPAVPSTTTYHHNYPKPLDPIVEDPEFLYGKIGDPSKTNATSTPIRNTTVQSPIKYANLTFPRRGQSVPPPSPVSDALLGSPNNSSYTLGRRGSHLLKSDGLYGYAQSEPPNGLYGTVQRTGRKIPPKIPPKPSLSALLGFPGKVGDSSDGGFMGDDVFLTTPQAGRKKSTLRENMIKAGEDSPAAVSGAVLDGNGVSVRNITHV